MKFEFITVILLTFLIEIQVNGQVVIELDLRQQCDCEQLVYQSECQMDKCQWTNGKCVTIPCQDHMSRKYCQQNPKCVWYQDRCSVFKDCKSYDIQQSFDCEDLHFTCKWNTQKFCEEKHNPKLSCKEQQRLFCDYGNEGLCVDVQGVCKEFKDCKDADDNEKLCKSASPACLNIFIDGTHYCPSIMSCEDQITLDCDVAKNAINGDKYTVCAKESEEICRNWRIEDATLETCIIKTHNTYHWIDNECKKCESVPLVGFMISFMVVLILY